MTKEFSSEDSAAEFPDNGMSIINQSTLFLKHTSDRKIKAMCVAPMKRDKNFSTKHTICTAFIPTQCNHFFTDLLWTSNRSKLINSASFRSLCLFRTTLARTRKGIAQNHCESLFVQLRTVPHSECYQFSIHETRVQGGLVRSHNLSSTRRWINWRYLQNLERLISLLLIFWQTTPFSHL